MPAKRSTFNLGAVIVLGMFAWTSIAGGAVTPVTGWVVHNGTSTVGGTAANPTFTAGDNITLMAAFDPVVLVNDGDFITATTTLTMNTRSTTGVNTLNTQLRIGLFNGPAGAIVASDTNNLGFIIEYTNVVAGGLIREQTNSPVSQTNPFTSPTNIGNGSQDTGADSIQGANPGPVTFTLTLTRNAGKIDVTGFIGGTDAVSGNPYSASYSALGYTPVATPFTFNRIGLLLGDGVNAASASLANSSITTVPEPASLASAFLAAGGVLSLRRSRRRS